MRVAVVHYHLRPSGVSRVIELACRSLQESGVRVAVLAGDIPADSCIPSLVPTAKIPGLDYHSSGSRISDSCCLRSDLETNARQLLGGEPDLWHIHNHSLGKNLTLIEIIAGWAREGRTLLLQIHDFAENQRPENYQRLFRRFGSALSGQLYPCTPRVAYALLNSRDEQLLKRTRFPGRLIRLPNPVLPLPKTEQLLPREFDADSIVVYPCRAIRRKNLGEALLLACGFPKGRRLLFARPPDQPCASYNRWKCLARTQSIAAELDLCTQQKISLGNLLSAADFLLTTSREEGFGMVFLEAWLYNKPLLGRNLPRITQDFRAEGLILDSLYNDFLGVPISLFGLQNVRRSILGRLNRSFSQFGMERPDESVCEKLLRRVIRKDRVDFGALETDFQEKIVSLASRSFAAAREIIPILPPLPSSATIQNNREIVEQQYSPDKYRSRLLAAYHSILSIKSEELTFASGSSDAILREFLLNN